MARSTIATILQQQGIPASTERPTSWQTFLRAHWDAVAAADFFTTEVWTVHRFAGEHVSENAKESERRFRLGDWHPTGACG